MRQKKSLVIYTDSYSQIAILTDEEAGVLLKGLIRYALTGENLISESRLVSLIFDIIKARIDQDNERDAMIADKRRSAAKQRWGSRKKEIPKPLTEPPKPEPSRFKRPTVEQIAEYIAQKGYDIDAQTIWDHYEAVGWKYGKGHQPIKDWKAAVRTWNNNQKKYDNERNHRISDTADDRDQKIIEQGRRIAESLLQDL